MNLYPIPGGTWAKSEADWKAGLKALGLDHKNFRDKEGKPLTREIPTNKAGLLEFLNFFAVDVYNMPAGTTVSAAVDVDALRRQHNAEAPPAPPAAPKPVDTSAVATLARMDNPGIDVDAICETICNAKGHALSRYATSVSVAYGKLAAG